MPEKHEQKFWKKYKIMPQEDELPKDSGSAP